MNLIGFLKEQLLELKIKEIAVLVGLFRQQDHLKELAKLITVVFNLILNSNSLTVRLLMVIMVVKEEVWKVLLNILLSMESQHKVLILIKVQKEFVCTIKDPLEYQALELLMDVPQ